VAATSASRRTESSWPCLSRRARTQAISARWVATGYGRESVANKTKSVTEITCHAKGAHVLYPDARSVIDIGGQDSKAISLDAMGAVRKFEMNDKCAAGTGRFLEVMARTLEVPLAEIGPRALAADTPAKISSTCTVFAESEVISLLAQGQTVERILAGLCLAISQRVTSLASRAGMAPRVIMTGGRSQEHRGRPRHREGHRASGHGARRTPNHGRARRGAPGATARLPAITRHHRNHGMLKRIKTKVAGKVKEVVLVELLRANLTRNKLKQKIQKKLSGAPKDGPSRLPIKSADKMKMLMGRYYVKARIAQHDPDQKIAWITSGGPVEILHAPSIRKTTEP